MLFLVAVFGRCSCLWVCRVGTFLLCAQLLTQNSRKARFYLGNNSLISRSAKQPGGQPAAARGRPPLWEPGLEMTWRTLLLAFVTKCFDCLACHTRLTLRCNRPVNQPLHVICMTLPQTLTMRRGKRARGGMKHKCKGAKYSRAESPFRDFSV